MSFTVLDAAGYARSLVSQLAPVADSVRNLATQMGLRPAAVRIVTSRFAGRRPGVGAEVILSVEDLVPTPEVLGLDGISYQDTEMAGYFEAGGVVLKGVSLTYAQDKLALIDPVELLGSDPSVTRYYEIEVLAGPKTGDKMRFRPSGRPHWQPGSVNWVVPLERVQGDRTRSGAPGP